MSTFAHHAAVEPPVTVPRQWWERRGFVALLMLLSAHGSDAIVMGGGISAMPSVHNALSVLFALAAWKVYRPLGWAFAAYAVAIWIGSIHLGWHYGLDGIVAAILTYAIWVGAGRLADRLERPLLHAGAQPALA